MSSEKIKDTMRGILLAESRAVAAIPVSDDYVRAVELITEHVHRRHGKLVTAGMGKSGLIAMNIAKTFCSTGTPATHLHPSEAQHGDLGVLAPDDVLLLVSNSGETCEILELIDLAEKLYDSLPVIVITGAADSPLAHRADAVLLTGNSTEVCALNLTPTTSATVMGVIGDVLVINVMREIGFSREDYARRHHGGSLGTAARSDIKQV